MEAIRIAVFNENEIVDWKPYGSPEFMAVWFPVVSFDGSMRKLTDGQEQDRHEKAWELLEQNSSMGECFCSVTRWCEKSSTQQQQKNDDVGECFCSVTNWCEKSSKQ
ncbi:MAG: hypothetical protein Q9170_002417 [Blastenia crenularia]